MAETNTYTINNNTPTETVGDNLTTDEQESLAVGEKLVAEQEGLLAGKYKDAQELEKAYVELQKKLGEDKEEDTETASTEKSEDKESEPDNNYLEDGKVNYSQVSETYGSEISGVMEKAGLDPWAISKEFHDNNGEYTPEMVEQLTGAGFSEAAVKSYFAGRASEAGYSSGSAEDISDAQINEIKQSVGGDQAYSNVVNWAKTNLDQSQTDAFDEVVNSGSIQAIKLAAAGLKAQYDEANGVEGRMVTGKNAPQNKDVYRSQAELVRAMSDRRYDSDPAYRRDVIEKLERSDVDF